MKKRGMGFVKHAEFELPPLKIEPKLFVYFLR